MTINVSNVDVIKPPKIACAIGARASAPGPTEKASGIIPRIIASVVIRIGLNRIRPADIKAELQLEPSAILFFAKSISRIAFFVTKPINRRIPIPEIILS